MPWKMLSTDLYFFAMLMHYGVPCITAARARQAIQLYIPVTMLMRCMPVSIHYCCLQGLWAGGVLSFASRHKKILSETGEDLVII